MGEALWLIILTILFVFGVYIGALLPFHISGLIAGLAISFFFGCRLRIPPALILGASIGVLIYYLYVDFFIKEK